VFSPFSQPFFFYFVSAMWKFSFFLSAPLPACRPFIDSSLGFYYASLSIQARNTRLT
jgi:hypothetical protein